jgi:hypothetical protein
MPAEPFELTAEAASYWQAVITIEKVASGLWKEHTLKGVSILWCAAELMFAATRRMLLASDAAAAIALAPSAIHQAFTGPVDSVPPDAVQARVNSVLGRVNTTPLRRDDPVLFLTDELVYGLLTDIAPEVERYLAIFDGVLGSRRQFMRAALGTLGAISFDASGRVNPVQTLAKLSAPLKKFVHETVERELAAAVRPHILPLTSLLSSFSKAAPLLECSSPPSRLHNGRICRHGVDRCASASTSA